MRDLTQGSIPAHIVRMAAPLAIGMVFQTAYYFIDLYFVGRLGDAAIAGVAAAGNLQFIVIALTQVLGVGTMVLISHAAGRKDRADANVVFNQSVRDIEVPPLLDSWSRLELVIAPLLQQLVTEPFEDDTLDNLTTQIDLESQTVLSPPEPSGSSSSSPSETPSG